MTTKTKMQARNRNRPEDAASRNGGAATAMPQLPLADANAALELPIGQLQPAPFQNRVEHAEALQELAASLAQDGQLEAIIVRLTQAETEAGASIYQIVAGHRRVAALRLNGATTVRAEVRDLDDDQAFRAGLIDNMKRHDLGPLDEARTFHYGITESGWTPERIAGWIGRPREFVAGRLRLLALDPAVTKLLEDHVVSVTVAELLQTVAPIKGALPQLIKHIEPGDTVRDIEREVEDVFRQHSIPLGKDTPFAWEEECARLGCLARNPDGKPVCLSSANYVRLTVELNCDAIAAAVERFFAAHGEVAQDAPIYYDLSGIEPGYMRYNYKPPAVKGFPAPPKGAATAGRTGILVTVPGTRSEFAQGKIKVELLKERPKTDRYGYPVQSAAEKEKTTTRQQERQRQARALQEPLQAAMMAAVDALAKKPARALAAGMVTRYRVADDLALVHDIQEAMELLHIKLPLGSNKGDGLVTRLAALGEAKLIRIIAAAKVWKLDDPFTYMSGFAKTVISAKRLKGQLPVLLGAKVAAIVLRDVEQLQQRMALEARPTATRKKKADKRPKAKAQAQAKANPRQKGGPKVKPKA